MYVAQIPVNMVGLASTRARISPLTHVTVLVATLETTAKIQVIIKFFINFFFLYRFYQKLGMIVVVEFLLELPAQIEKVFIHHQNNPFPCQTKKKLVLQHFNSHVYVFYL